MAKSATVEVRNGSDQGLVARVKAWPQRTKSFYTDVRTEMKKVTAPAWKEVRATTTVVIIAVFVFAAYFWAIDLVLGRAINAVFKYFGG
jgi:preprotein translocase subunit SecE